MTKPLLPNPKMGNNPPGNNFIFFLTVFFLTVIVMRMLSPPSAPNILEKPINTAKSEFDTDDSADSMNSSTDIAAATDTNTNPNLNPNLAKATPANQPDQFAVLGSLDPNSPYRMLVTLTNRGAAVARIELNDKQYRDVQDRTGYLGQIVVDLAVQERYTEQGVVVQTVGHGTPAAKAGLQVGDRIVQVRRSEKGDTDPDNYTDIVWFSDLRNFLLDTKPNDIIELDVLRHVPSANTPSDNTADSTSVTTSDTTITPPSPTPERITLSVELGTAPVNIVRPEVTPNTYEEYQELVGLYGFRAETSNPLSFLMTLNSVGSGKGKSLPWPDSVGEDNLKIQTDVPSDSTIERELPGVSLRNSNWELVLSTETEAVFRKILGVQQLEIVKTYRLAKKSEQPKPPNLPNEGYHLTMGITIRNLATVPQSVSYQLDGPTGLPIEGAWYGRKNGPGWSGGYGLRDVVVRFQNGPLTIVPNYRIARDTEKPYGEAPLKYIGVDTRYFQCTAIPQTESPDDVWFSKSTVLRVGPKYQDWSPLTDVSWRLVGKDTLLAPTKGDRSESGDDDSKLSHTYTVFVGPKVQSILSQYNLRDTLYSGWFWFVAEPMLWILHTFYFFCGSYAVAIILLTATVRLAMFRMSKNQAITMQKMARMQPEIKALKEKHKGDTEGFVRAQQALYKKHDFHSLGGCLPMFLQLPIFIGLYSALSIDVALYGAPLISENFRWCNDLSAPDMLFDWSQLWVSIGWPSFNTGYGTNFFAMFKLGPYFNILPLLTIILFIAQQQIMMPPPTDPEQKMQRTMMNYMMLLMGVMFFRVPSGLCLYFVVSTVWGMAERRFMPKLSEVPPSDGDKVLTLGADEVQVPSESSSLSSTSSAESTAAAEPQRRSMSRSSATVAANRSSQVPEKKGWFARLQEMVDEAKKQQESASETKSSSPEKTFNPEKYNSPPSKKKRKK